MHLVGFIIRIRHDAGSHERKIPKHVIIAVFTCTFTQWSMCNVLTTI